MEASEALPTSGDEKDTQVFPVLRTSSGKSSRASAKAAAHAPVPHRLWRVASKMIRRRPRITPLVVLVFLCQTAAVVQGGTLSRADVDTLWERLLVEERYEAIQYFYGPAEPNVYRFPDSHRELVVQEAREGLLWGLFGGLGAGGGWRVSGRLEAEALSSMGMLQLYSKASSKWSPGFATFWMPDYDEKKYPTWEFRLVLRNPNDRRQVQKVKSIEFGPGDIIPAFNEDGSPVLERRGQRVPRGELTYDQTRGVAIIRVLGLRAPITLEVPIDSR